MAELSKARKMAEQDAGDLRDGLDDLQKMFDEERARLLDKMKKELKVKDRQIESLEEQLRRATRAEIKKMKRGSRPQWRYP